MDKLIKYQIDAALESIKIQNESITYLLIIADTLNVLDLCDVGYLSVHTYDKNTSVFLYLARGKEDSRLPHTIAQEFGVQLKKSQSWDKASLRYTSEPINIENGKTMTLIVEGSIPPTCHLEFTEEAIPEDKIVRTRIITKIVCDEPSDSSTSEPAGAITEDVTLSF